MSTGKNKLREQLRARLKTVHLDRVQAAKAVCAHLGRDAGFQKANTVALFAARPDEIDSILIHSTCAELGKRTVYPRVDKTRLQLDFFLVESAAVLFPGAFGIREPQESQRPEEQIDLFLIPGLGFTGAGARLGRGTGYYDRSLTRDCFAQVARYGLAFDEQILSAIPMEDNDLWMHRVFTPTRVYSGRISGGRVVGPIDEKG